MKFFRTILLGTLLVMPFVALAQEPETAPAEEGEGKGKGDAAKVFDGLALRSIGPAFISGRIVSIAVDPANRAHYYVAAASGGVWKTRRHRAN